MSADARVSRELVSAVRAADRVLVLSGAGMSAESGVPTFRGAEGLWKGFDPRELATTEAFARSPERVWEWYRWRLATIGAVRPHAGHLALAALERHVAVDVVTQNVDGLHQEAGSTRVVALHGSIRRVRCADSSCRLGDGPLPPDGPAVPRCPCGRSSRPAVVWFGEALPRRALGEALAAAEACDVALVVGTSGIVEPAASLPGVALASGAVVAEINPEPTPLSASVHHHERGLAGVILPELVARTFGAAEAPEHPAA